MIPYHFKSHITNSHLLPIIPVEKLTLFNLMFLNNTEVQNIGQVCVCVYSFKDPGKVYSLLVYTAFPILLWVQPLTSGATKLAV